MLEVRERGYARLSRELVLMPAGRPTLYSDEILVKTQEYLDGGYKGELIDPDDLKLGYDGEPYPSIAGLSLYLDITRETVYDWAKQEEKAAFSDIVKKLMATQEVELFKGGITGRFNSSITKLALTKHNYSDKSDNVHSGPEGGPIPIAEIRHTVVDPRNTDS